MMIICGLCRKIHYARRRKLAARRRLFSVYPYVSSRSSYLRLHVSRCLVYLVDAAFACFVYLYLLYFIRWPVVASLFAIRHFSRARMRYPRGPISKLLRAPSSAIFELRNVFGVLRPTRLPALFTIFFFTLVGVLRAVSFPGTSVLSVSLLQRPSVLRNIYAMGEGGPLANYRPELRPLLLRYLLISPPATRPAI